MKTVQLETIMTESFFNSQKINSRFISLMSKIKLICPGAQGKKSISWKFPFSCKATIRVFGVYYTCAKEVQQIMDEA